MRPSQQAALAAVAARLVDTPFVVGGSALLALLGAEVEPGDIDLVVDAGSRDTLESATGQWWRGSRVETDHPHLMSSWVADLDVDGEPVEVIGGLALRSQGVHWRVPMRRGETVEVMGQEIRLAAVGHWVVLYSLCRPSRAVELLPFLTPIEKQKTLMELPPGMGVEWPLDSDAV